MDDLSIRGILGQYETKTQEKVTQKEEKNSPEKEKEIFEAWQKCAYNPQTWGVQWYESYVGNIKIYNLDQQNDRRYGVELVEAFPKTIIAQQLSSDAAATPQTVDVTFSYRYWKNMGTDFASDRPMLDRIQTAAPSPKSTAVPLPSSLKSN